MQLKWGQKIFVILLFSILSCNNNTEKKFTEPADSLLQSRDSATAFAGACYESFFKGLSVFPDSNAAYLLIDSSRRITLTQYFRDEFMSPVSSYGLKDIDSDGVRELIIYNNTGGAHCCDEFSIFARASTTEYLFKSRLMGDVCIDPADNIFTFSFNESLGYFFSCYACQFPDSVPGFRSMRALSLVYKNGKLMVKPYTAEDEKQNLDNLKVLHDHGFEKLEGMIDNGWRKEFAINTVLWHFNHGKDWTTTKKLFDEFYRFPDRKKVWNELYRTIIETSRENTF